MMKISIRKYALLTGVSHTAVAKAIKAGNISKGYDHQSKKIIVELADSEWGKAIKDREGLVSGNGTDLQLEDTILSGDENSPISNKISFAEARRRKEIYHAEIARITALREQGLYVEKEKVYSDLFAFGKQVRTSIQAIPDRVTDHMLAATNRNAAHLILSNAIHEALEQLTKVPV